MRAHKFDAWSFISGLVLIVVGLFVLLPNTSTLLEFGQLSLFFDLIYNFALTQVTSLSSAQEPPWSLVVGFIVLSVP